MVWSLVFALLPLRPLALPPQASWSLRYIELRITVDPTARTVGGVARLTVSAAPGATDLILDVSDSLTVDSSSVSDAAGAGTTAGVREPGHVRFAMPPAAGGAFRRIAVWYHGHPARRAVGFGEAGGGDRVASFGLPRSAREWWPTLDDPAIKSDSADIWITAPAALVAVSNGRQAGRVVDGRGATTHWTVRHPIYSDAVSFALGDYTAARSSVRLAGGRRMPIEWYVFPEDSVKAARDFAPVPEILSFYESRLGPYPFGDEKYALVEFARQSFREGQTLSHLGAALITGTHENEQVFAHEVAHQWFGNSLTVRSWEDIWLNESLSEYMAWQWIRKSRGDTAYRALLDQAAAAETTAPIVPANPDDFNTLFGNATFQRGPAVLAMLERQLGPAVFAKALRGYVRDHSYGSVGTADFQRACERATGKPLEDFFAHWIRGNAKLPRSG